MYMYIPIYNTCILQIYVLYLLHIMCGRGRVRAWKFTPRTRRKRGKNRIIIIIRKREEKVMGDAKGGKKRKSSKRRSALPPHHQRVPHSFFPPAARSVLYIRARLRKVVPSKSSRFYTYIYAYARSHYIYDL